MDMNLDELDEKISMMLSRLDLEGETCGLKHSVEDPAENYPAIDYLCQNLGDQETGDIYQQIRIPVCAECAEALFDTNWILMYCTYCHASQWVYRPKAKYEYPKGNRIYWQDVCPFCVDNEDRPDDDTDK